MCPIPNGKLTIDVADMLFDGGHSNEQLFCNVTIGSSNCDQLYYFEFTVAQGLNQPENGVMGLNNSWIHLNREGDVVPLNHESIVIYLVDAPGGYATLQQTPDGKYALSHHVIGNPANPLWTSEYGIWQMVWSSPVPTSMDMPSFPIIG